MTTSAVKLSIILPVFNVADYLEDCLQSIIDESTDIAVEALLIEDCSTDSSREICTRYADRHPALFTLIEHEQNSGVSVARNTGLDHACGDYFMFVDPDDLLPPGALRHLYDAATTRDADIVKGNNSIFDEAHEAPARYDVQGEQWISGDAVLTTLYRHDRVRGHPWGKLFNRARLGQLRFPVGVRMAQDLQYCAEVFASANTLLLIDQPVYRYRNHTSGSTGRKFETGAYLDWLGSIEAIGRFAHNRQQRRAYRGLLLRTLAQIARECRDVSAKTAAKVLQTIEAKCREWNVSLSSALLESDAPLRSLGHYLKFRQALGRIRHNLTAGS